MYPSIREGELITVEPVVPNDVTLGDIVLYRSERGLIAHRVVGSSPTQSSVLSPHYLLRGDASLSRDEPVEAHQILGRVIRVERDGRSVALASRGAKMWHKVRRLASGLKGWMTQSSVLSPHDSSACQTQSSVLSSHYSSGEPW